MCSSPQKWCALLKSFYCIIMVHIHPEIYNAVPILSSLNPVPILYSMLIQYHQYCKYWIDSSLIMNSIVSRLVSTALDLYCTESYQISTVNRWRTYTVWYQDLQSLLNQYRIFEHGSCDFLDTAWKNKKRSWCVMI